MKFNGFVNETALDGEQEDFNLQPSFFAENSSTNNNNPTIAHIRALQPLSSHAKATDDDQSEPFAPSGLVNIKQHLFLVEPMGTKSTLVLPGIGHKYARQLAECGVGQARRLLGLYLIIRDDPQFVIWLTLRAKISKHSAWQCTHALRAWCQANL